MSDAGFEKRTPDMSTWKGRLRRGEKCSHSFKDFVAKAKTYKEGRQHLERHHGGHGL